jgi:hypothetical protein
VGGAETRWRSWIYAWSFGHQPLGSQGERYRGDDKERENRRDEPVVMVQAPAETERGVGRVGRRCLRDDRDDRALNLDRVTNTIKYEYIALPTIYQPRVNIHESFNMRIHSRVCIFIEQ